MTRVAARRHAYAQVTDPDETAGPFRETIDIFEGTEQIQQLVMSRAISGLRIE